MLNNWDLQKTNASLLKKKSDKGTIALVTKAGRGVAEQGSKRWYASSLVKGGHVKWLEGERPAAACSRAFSVSAHCRSNSTLTSIRSGERVPWGEGEGRGLPSAQCGVL